MSQSPRRKNDARANHGVADYDALSGLPSLQFGQQRNVVALDVVPYEDIGIFQPFDCVQYLSGPIVPTLPGVYVNDSDAVHLGGVVDEPVALRVEEQALECDGVSFGSGPRHALRWPVERLVVLAALPA